MKVTETDNIVFATVPLIHNPSAAASPDPGVPKGIREPVPNTGPSGTIDLHLDVYRTPSPRPTPVVVQIHGGGWLRGDRPSSSSSFGGFFAAGASVVTVQYRNAIDAPAPAAIQDVRCALAWVKANAGKYNFDLNRVIVWGGSAGGHLALMAGYAPASFNPAGCTDQPPVAAVLDDYGPTDLVAGLKQHGSTDFTHQWLGLDLPLPAASPAAGRPAGQRWPEPSPAVLARAREMSPLTYIRPGLPPTFIVNGDSDRTVDPTQSAELKKALDAAHIPNGQDVIAGGGHGGFSTEESEKAMLLSLKFLKANGAID
ncbi:alpha/beta hydrolase [Granulicella rosea]|uniref:alpha/beta hydrolase n=1 Tax=Granulicella rosea TaxID=474952 RepID=UPI001595AEED|nr:alpha/beta hydrolase [Granulicella rosea]